MTKEIESKLEILHQSSGGLNSGSSDESPMEEDEAPRVPIAKVNIVYDGSPAYHAVRFQLSIRKSKTIKSLGICFK